MAKRIGIVLLIAALAWLVAGPGPAAEREGKGPPDAASVLDGLRGQIDLSARTPLPADLRPWEARRQEVLAAVSAGLGLPEREPMRAAVTYQKPSDDLVIEEVMYLWAERAYVSAHLIRGRQPAGRRPAIVVCPDWLGHYTRPSCRDWVFAFARQGCAVLVIEDPRIGKRVAPDAGLFALASAAGLPVTGIQVFDALRGLDYLATRADVDPGRIGLAGFGQGVRVAWLAAAFESRFRFLVAVDGATTLGTLAQVAATKHAALADPSAYFGGMPRTGDWDQIAALTAPRPAFLLGHPGDACLPREAFDRVARSMKQVYGPPPGESRLRCVWSDRPDERAERAERIDEVSRWVESQATSLPPADARPQPCSPPQNADFSMLRYLQRRIARQAAGWPAALASDQAWQKHRSGMVKRLGAAIRIDGQPRDEARVEKSTESDGLSIKIVRLAWGPKNSCPAMVVRPAGAAGPMLAGLVLSHDAHQCAAAPEIAEAAKRLAAQGFLVVVPDHASPHPGSLQAVEGADLTSLYGLAEGLGLSPLALRVADDLAAVRYLARQPEVGRGLLMAGQGLGGIDACLAALLDDRLAGVLSLGATTLRDWGAEAAPEQQRYGPILPHLPAILTTTDFDYCYAALAPRPLVLVRPRDGWPKSGFQQVAATAAAAYRLTGSEASLAALSSREMTEERQKAAPAAVQPLMAIARAMLPTPPKPGVVGPPEGLRSRLTVDSAPGLVWVVRQMAGEEQEFAGGGYRLVSWSFFNDNGPAEQGRATTPLIFKKEGPAYKLTGVGKPRTNAGTGRQTFPFELAEGSDAVGPEFLFGFYAGSPPASPNAGAVEFDDSPQDLVTILTLDGAMENQAVRLGSTYREQSSWPRAYSIQAVSERKK